MAKYSSIAFCVSFFLACIFFSKCDAIGDNPKLHIVYMGTLPKPPYSPSSHHLSMLQQVVKGTNATNLLVHSYKRSLNGFAAMLTDQQKKKLSKMEGVVSVFPSRTLQLHTTRSWDFMGFPESVKRRQTVERDFVVGVLDTGIWPESDSFRDQGLGPLPKKWKGAYVGGKNFTCNKKIIGARFYIENSTRDTFVHGTHTASTAAGNFVHDASFYELAKGTARRGVPSVRIAAYKVCNSEECPDAAILAAFDDAIADGVDIIFVSLGVYADNFYENSIAIGSFHAMARGILTVQSAGNSGPEPGLLYSSLAPWILTVAASTIGRKFIDKVVLGNGKTLTGKSINFFTSNGTKFPIAQKNGDGVICPEDDANTCQCLNSHLVKGKIVLCGYVSESNTVEGGQVGIITQEISEDFPATVTQLPSSALSPHDYYLISSYTNSKKYPAVELRKSEIIDDHTAPIVAEFSSRGPNMLVPKILKPDITAPGVDILAAFSRASSLTNSPYDKNSAKYNIIYGTSMSCPHVTGIATYVKTFHLGWSPASIKSAIMTSSKPMNGSKYGVGEYAYGFGHVNPVQAIYPGLVYDIVLEDYFQIICILGYDSKKIKQISRKDNPCSQAPHRSLVRNLNYPALAIHVQPLESFKIKFKRTVTNVGIANSNYKATILPNLKINITMAPEILSFKSLDENQSFVVTITGGKLSNQTVLTSSLVWSDGTYNVRSPIVINVSK